MAALAALAPDPLLVAGLWGGARAGMALTLARVPYARDRGAASGFAGPGAGAGALAGFVASAALVAGALGGLPGGWPQSPPWSPGSPPWGPSPYAVWAATRATCSAPPGVVAETLGLVVAAARW